MKPEQSINIPAIQEISKEGILELIKKDVKKLVADVLEIDIEAVNEKASYFEQGLDSGNLLLLVEQLETKLKIQLYPTLLFEYKNIEELSEYLMKEFSEKFSTIVHRIDNKNEAVRTNEELIANNSESAFYRFKWEEAGFTGQSFKEQSDNILIFDKGDDLFEAMSRRVKEDTGIKLVLVKIGKTFRSITENSFEINPASKMDYMKLLEKLNKSGLFPQKILHAWSSGSFSSDELILKHQLEVAIYSVFYLSQVFMELYPKDKLDMLYSYTATDNLSQPVFAAVSGFVKTIRLENPKLSYKTMEIICRESELHLELKQAWVSDAIMYEMYNSNANESELRYKAGIRFVKRAESFYPVSSRVIFRDEGAYLITGGAGGLGLIFAEYLSSKSKATVILTGRSELSGGKQQKLQELEKAGAKLVYIKSDISDRKAVMSMVDKVEAEYGHIHGVIHSAGEIRDSFIVNKSMEEFNSVIAPKIYGTVNLDEAIKNRELDFFVLFSSASAITGNIGQGDYAFANAFLDNFAHRRNELLKQNMRYGKTLSINWPLWKEGGMQVDEKAVAWLEKNLGIKPLDTMSGKNAFEIGISRTEAQLMVAKGNVKLLSEVLNSGRKNIQTGISQLTLEADYDKLDEKVQLPLQKVDMQSRGVPFMNAEANAKDRTDNNEPIAIIGISGIMPQSEDLEEFWENIEAGRDLISEIPADRWDWKAWYGDPKKESNRSNIKWGGFMKEVDKFDPMFFGISPREAELMDPQQRIFLQTVWSAIEDAGYKPSDLSGTKTGLFAGVITWDYHELLSKQGADIQAQTSTGMSHCLLTNRISYILNLLGPSEPIETACSSSLVAINHAIEAIRSGDCEMAIAGGVNALISPTLFISFSKAGMLCEDGRCKAFDKSANGYVRGEGVGAVLLKPLSKAMADRDNIYAVIKGSAVNHGGRANSLTAPNPNSQAEVLLKAWKQSAIDPSTVTYIETHGTGTSLGDPVEITALKKAFEKLYKDWGIVAAKVPHCGLGSVKTNIGHLESAAGMAGIFKVLYAMKHKKLPANIHFKELNPYVRLENSPFFIVDEMLSWENLRDSEGQIIPKRAGVSSFGFGGTNAHIVLEEYIDLKKLNKNDSGTTHIVILSARDKERLKEYAKKLNKFIAKNYNLSLLNISYTLQTGREAMEERLAVVVASIQELSEKLDKYTLEGTAGVNLFLGNVKEDKSKYTLLLDGEEGKGYIQAVIKNRKMEKLAQLWVSGVNINWELLYSATDPDLISLPAYPFAKERYWLPSEPLPESKKSQKSDMPPLLDEIDIEQSMNSGLVYTKEFSAKANLLGQHKVLGKPVLPGVVHLEMACEVMTEAKPKQAFYFENIMWLKPLIVEDKKAVKIAVGKNNKLGVSYEIFEGEKERSIIYSKGELYSFTPSEKKLSQYIDIERFLSEFSLHIDKKEIYSTFKAMGINYGDYFRGVSDIWLKDGEALGRLVIPKGFEIELSGYVLNPVIMDAALQTAAFLQGDSKKPYLPFRAKKLEFLKPLKPNSYAYIKCIDKHCFNISILDENGLVCVDIKEIEARTLMKNEKETALPEDFFYVPVWRVAALEADSKPVVASKPPERKAVLLISPLESIGLEAELTDYWQESSIFEIKLGTKNRKLSENSREVNKYDPLSMDECIKYLNTIDIIYYMGGIQTEKIELFNLEELERSQLSGVISFFRLIKALNHYELNNRQLQINIVTNNAYNVLPNDETSPYSASLSGFARAMAKEYGNIKLNCIDIDLKPNSKNRITEVSKELVEDMLAVPDRYSKKELAIRNRKLYFKALEPIILAEAEQIVYREKGVYLILGGAGGIGFELSCYLAEHFKASLIWLGRSTLDKGKREKMKEVELKGGRVLYIQADAENEDSMRSAIDKAKESFGKINGVIHSAIVLKDIGIGNMDEKTLCEVLAPKVRGSVLLHKLFRGEALDFMAFFSSAQSITANAGQSNYAAACAFKDAYAHFISQHENYPVKIINWGYWGSVGVVATEEYNMRMEAMGIYSISPNEGMEALGRILQNRSRQVIAAKASHSFLESIGCDFTHRFEAYPQLEPSSIKTLENKLINLNNGESYPQQLLAAFEELEQFSVNLLLEAFRKMGVFYSNDERFDKDGLKRQLHILPSFNRLFDCMLEILCEAEYIVIQGQVISTTDKIKEFGRNTTKKLTEAIREDLVLKYPEIQVHINLLWTCMTNYPEVLRGDIPATDIIFPDSSMKLVEGIYKGNKDADYYNRLVVFCIKTFIDERRKQLGKNEKIKILEIGAGTGGTSAAVLDGIREYESIIKYYYTDISAGFTLYGRKLYGEANPFVEFQNLNIEEDVEKQGYKPADFDIIIASNVLHATVNIRTTLKNSKTLLKANGWLLINELTKRTNFLTLVFGMLDGWWLYQDESERIKGSPLLTTDTWEGVLKEVGFENMLLLGKRYDEENEAAQKVIIAESNGIVRRENKKEQKLTLKAMVNLDTELDIQEPSIVNLRKADYKETGVLKQSQKPKAVVSEPEQIKEFIKKEILGSISEVLKLDIKYIALDKQFSEYGVDSITGIELINKINEQFKLSLRTTTLFDYSNVKDLTLYIFNSFGNKISVQINSINENFIAAEAVTKKEGLIIDQELKLLEELAAGNIDAEEVYRILEGYDGK